MAPRTDHCITDLDGTLLGTRRLAVRASAPRRRSGWTPFALDVAATDDEAAQCLAEGLFSRGGRGVMPWIELTRYEPPMGGHAADGAVGWEQGLFDALARLIPPGGHVMAPIERPDEAGAYLLLTRGMPPAATRNGVLLLRAGFRHVRFFYLAEGGWEGEPKLWGEKPPDGPTAVAWDRATVKALRTFLASPPDSPGIDAALERARRLVEELASTEPSGRRD